MPRHATKGRRQPQSPRQTESNDNDSSSKNELDFFHNSSSPSCLRLANIALNELRLAEDGSGGNDNNPPNAWTALVREYILWGRPSSLASTVPSSKKKRKKKKKKKGGAPAAAAATTVDSNEAVPSGEDEATTEEANNRTAPTTTTNLENAVFETTASQPSMDTSSSAEIPKIKETWESRRPARRREMLDRYLDGYRHGLKTRGIEPSPPDQILQKLDKFLAWLSTSTTKVRSNDRKPRDSSSYVAPFDVEKVQRTRHNIECATCGMHTSLYLENHVVLQSSLPLDDRTVSFRYEAMEEGEGKALPPHAITLLHPRGPSSWTLQGPDGSPLVWTRETLDMWLQEYVLLGGLGYDRVVVNCSGQNMTEEQLSDLKSHISETGRTALIECRQFVDALATFGMKLQSFPQHGDAIDMKHASKLLELDDELSDVLERILSFALRLLRVHQRVSVYNARVAQKLGYPAPILLSKLFENDSVALQLLGPVVDAMGVLFSSLSSMENAFIAQSDGEQVPHLFFNATMRRIFLEFLWKKFGVLQGLVQKIDSAVDGQDQSVETVTTVYMTSLYRVVHAMDRLLEIMVPHHAQNSTELDDACHDVLYLLLEWTRHSRQTQISKILEEHEHRRLKLAESFSRAQKMITLAQSSMPADNSDSKAVQTWYEAWRKRDISETSVEEVGDLSSIRQTIASKAGAMIGIWIKLSKYRSVKPDTYPSQVVRMPYNIIVFSSTGKFEAEHASCGDGAESRAAFLLSGLLFDWMSLKYDDWQAETIGEELLVDLTADEAWSPVAKGAKKNKKKQAVPEKEVSPPKADTAHGDEVDDGPPVDEKVANTRNNSSRSGEMVNDTGIKDVLSAACETKVKENVSPPDPVSESSSPTDSNQNVATTSSPTDSNHNVASTAVVEKENGKRSPSLGQSPSDRKTSQSSESMSLTEATATPSSSGSTLEEQSDSNPRLVAGPPEAETTKRAGKRNKKETTDTNIPVRPASPSRADRRRSQPSKAQNAGNSPIVSSAELDKMSGMGVIDQSSFQTAHEFLLGRYVQTTKSKKPGKHEAVVVL